MSQFFEILIFRQDIWASVHYVREIKVKSVKSPDILNSKSFIFLYLLTYLFL